MVLGINLVVVRWQVCQAGPGRTPSLAGEAESTGQSVRTGKGAFMRQVLASMAVFCLFIAWGAAVYAVGAGDQEFSKGENLLKNKQYAEARTLLEAGIQKDPSSPKPAGP